MQDQLTLFTEYESRKAEREALLRGALYHAGLPGRDVPGFVLLCRELIDAEGSCCPPSLEDLRIACDKSLATIKRRLRVLVELGIVVVARDADVSAAEPLRRAIDWDRTARMARREPVAPEPVVANKELRQPEVCETGLGRSEPTDGSLGRPEPTRADESRPQATADDVCFDIYPPPTSPRNVLPAEEEGVDFLWREAERAVRSVGVDDAAGCCGAARRRGATAGQVLALAAAWSPDRGLGPGVLHRRIGALSAESPGGAAASVSSGAPAASGRRREFAETLATLERERNLIAAERATLERWEAAYGDEIAAATEEEIVARLERSGAATIVGELRRRGRDSPLVRGVLLEAWSATASAAV